MRGCLFIGLAVLFGLPLIAKLAESQSGWWSFAGVGLVLLIPVALVLWFISWIFRG